MTGNVVIEMEGGDREVGLDDASPRNFVVLTGGAIAAKGQMFQAAVTVAKGASSNICNVSIQLQDVQGNDLAAPALLDVFLSDSAAGLALTATTPSGGIAAGASGAVLGVLTTSKAIRAQTSATGLFVLAITDSAKTAFVVCASIGGKTVVLTTLASGNYD